MFQWRYQETLVSILHDLRYIQSSIFIGVEEPLTVRAVEHCITMFFLVVLLNACPQVFFAKCFFFAGE
jgi:hypothetical protein